MAVTGAAFGAYLTTREHARDLPDLSTQNPLKLTAAVQFALFLAAVLLAGRFLADRFGDAGLLVTAAISGLVDVDAITLSVGRMVGDGVAGTSVAGLAVFLAAAVNQVTKLGLLWALDSRSLALKVLPAAATFARRLDGEGNCPPTKLPMSVAALFRLDHLEAGEFVADHDDLLAVLGFHDVSGLHAHGPAEPIFHGHLAVLEHVHGRTVFEFELLGDIAHVHRESGACDGEHRGHDCKLLEH
jgi:hypothetical protein